MISYRYELNFFGVVTGLIKYIKVLIMFLLLIMLFFGCSNDTVENIANTEKSGIAQKGFLMGFLPIPSDGQTFEELYRAIPKYCDFVPVWGKPSPFYQLASVLSGNWGDIFIEEYIHGNSLIPLVNLSFLGEGMTLATPEELRDASLSNKSWRNKYRQAAVDVVKILKPQYISIGNEVNRWYEKYGTDDDNPNGFQHYVSLYNDIYSSIKEISPDTSVFCTFSREIVSENREADLSVLTLFNPGKLDMLVFTSYPHSLKDVDTPKDIPVDYYAKAAQYFKGKPFGFSEIAWPSDVRFGGEKAQAEFVIIACTSLTKDLGINLQLVGWPWLCDLDNNDSTGLIKRDGTEKAAFNVWKNLYKGD
jgi:hypothetical protein